MHRLADETSPYLRQHADNPVDWYPWGPEAFEVARATDRPILLSIGYSACHWCHVMAHESFEDPATAAVVNRLFVPVKVDREERPDVDAVYMEAVQAMTGAGGWPLTAFCTPDGEAFFCGTYFPREPTHGRPSFLQVCEAVDDAWRTKRDDLLEQAGHVTAHLRASTLAASSEIPGIEALAGVCADLLAQHDPTDGGFGVAPKFPQTMSLEVLLREHVRSGGAPQALAAVVRSLDAMAAGGIHDHLGGGFARYSVDRQWLVPHFEKMLYDQALLARTYLHAWQVTGLERFLDVVEDTIGYVLDHLQHPSGGWFAAEDADSEGVEGKYYVWTPDQVRDALGADAPAALAWWGVTPGGNFEGATILNRLHAPPDEAEPAEISVARARLVSARAERVHPGMDDKVLTEWNALFLSTLAEAAAATGNEAWLCAAVTNAEFLLAELRRPDGRWLRSWQDDGTEGRARHLALATDHAALVDAFVRVGEATGQARWIDEARQAADAMIELFWDHEGTGLFTTGHDAERLIVRAKDLLDSATPSANSLAAVALLRLAALTGETRWHDRATEIVGLLAPTAVRQPGSLGHLLGALDLLARGIDEIAIVGDLPDLVEAVHGHYLPGAVVAWGERYASPLWEGRIDGLAYVCRDFSCLAPVSTIEALLGQLEATTTAP